MRRMLHASLTAVPELKPVHPRHRINPRLLDDNELDEIADRKRPRRSDIQKLLAHMKATEQSLERRHGTAITREREHTEAAVNLAREIVQFNTDAALTAEHLAKSWRDQRAKFIAMEKRAARS